MFISILWLTKIFKSKKNSIFISLFSIQELLIFSKNTNHEIFFLSTSEFLHCQVGFPVSWPSLFFTKEPRPAQWWRWLATIRKGVPALAGNTTGKPQHHSSSALHHQFNKWLTVAAASPPVGPSAQCGSPPAYTRYTTMQTWEHQICYPTCSDYLLHAKIGRNVLCELLETTSQPCIDVHWPII